MSTVPLRVWEPDSPRESGPESLTLRAAFERFLLPDLKLDGAAGTIEAYYGALNHWEARTSDPPIADIDDRSIETFRDSLLGDSRSPATVRKNWRHLRAILRRVGPQGAGNARGQGLVGRVPWAKMPREKPKLPRLVTHEELDRLYDGCAAAVWPRSAVTGVSPPLLWRAYLVLVANYGPRSFDGWSLGWSGVSLVAVPPSIRFRAAKTQKLQGLPLNVTAVKHLAAIRRDSEHVFYPTRSDKQFYREWKRINDRAGLSAPVELRDLRETCLSVYERISPGSGKWILGHAASGVSETYYLNPTDQVREAVERFPQPASFIAGCDALGPRQLSLF